MNYWFIINDVRLGPLTLSEARRMPLTPDTPAWCNGLSDWVTVRDLPELSTPTGPDMAPEGSPAPPPIPQPECAATPSSECAAPSEQPREQRQCPPSYVGWNVAATLLCCLPIGVVGIFFASKVNPAFMAGDYERAKKMSDRAAWCVILSITLGLLSMPLQMIVSML